jgi:hypothetical protein
MARKSQPTQPTPDPELEALKRFIGQAHLLPGLSLAGVRDVLALAGVTDWNECGKAKLLSVKAALETEAARNINGRS